MYSCQENLSHYEQPQNYANRDCVLADSVAASLSQYPPYLVDDGLVCHDADHSQSVIDEYQVADDDSSCSLHPGHEESDGAVEAVEEIATDVERLIVEGIAFDADVSRLLPLVLPVLVHLTVEADRPSHRVDDAADQLPNLYGLHTKMWEMLKLA